MNLEEYIKEYYPNADWWFVSECCQQQHKDRVQNIANIKYYLDGHRKNDNQLINIDGRMVEPTRIKLNFAKVLLDYVVSFLLKNPITLICDDENTLKQMQDVYKKSKMKREDIKIYKEMKVAGQAFQYLFFDENDNIQSKVLLSENSYPVVTDTGNYVAFIYHYMTSKMIEYYTVYYPDRVEEWNTIDGKCKLISTSINYSGLPIPFRNPKETNIYEGKSDVEDWKSIIDNMEKLTSKYQDALYKFITGIPVMTGSKMRITKDGQGAIDPRIVGYYLGLEDGSTFDFKQNKTDYQSMELMYKTLFSDLLISSCIPAVSMNAQDVSNLSETSIRMMYQLIILKCAMDSMNLLDGFYIRWEQIKRMLSLKGIQNLDSDVECEFTMEIPQNAAEVINNLQTLRDMNGISFDTMLAKNPYVADVVGEKQKIEQEQNEDSINLDDVDNTKGVDNNGQEE